MRTIKITEEQLKSIGQSIANELNNRDIINEMAIPMKDFSNKLQDKLWGIFDNLACICIFHNVNPNVIPHWAERATEPLIPWFSQDITQETIKKRNTAVNKAFRMAFNEDCSAISVKSFQNLIIHYSKRPNKELRMFVKDNADYYYQTYKDTIVNLLEVLKISIIERDYNKWVDSVNEFCQELI